MIEGPNGTNIFAENHPAASPVTERPEKLIILNTSTRKIPILMPTTKTILTVKDWEEFPDDDEEGKQLWETLIWDILNPGIETPHGPFNTEAALFSRNTEVLERTLGAIPLSFVTRNMEVLDINGKYTKVLGRYKGIVYNQNVSEPQWYTSGVRHLKSNGAWKKKKEDLVKSTKHRKSVVGYNLITDSGTFIANCKGKTLKVRDFTEVGWQNIDETYEIVRLYLNKKKEAQQSSNTVCVSDFSSQGWCSCWQQIFS
jgi:hypothetical protein